MRAVYVVSGGVSKFTKARHDKTFQAVVKEAYDYAIADTRKAIHCPQIICLIRNTTQLRP